MVQTANNDDAVAPRTLVLGAAIGYEPEAVQPFLRSLRRAGYTGMVGLIVAEQAAAAFESSPEMADVLLVTTKEWAPNRARVFRTRKVGRFLWMPLQLLEWAVVRGAGLAPFVSEGRRATLAERLFHPQLSRFFHYRRIIEGGSFDRILLSDVRDVYFQSDPFESLPPQGLSVSVEDPSYTVATEYWNARWIKAAFGPDVLAEIGDNRVTCAGVTFGDAGAILSYVQAMVQQLLSMRLRAFIGQGDQGLHNYLVWTGQLGEVHHMESMRSPIVTLNGVAYSELQFGPDARLVNPDGSTISIIHQYDRTPQLAAELLETLSKPST